MSLTLHKVLHDGTVVHEDFTRESWAAAMRDSSLARKWAHPPDDCFDPIERIRGIEFKLVQTSQNVPAPPKAEVKPGIAWHPSAPLPLLTPVEWPPETELTPQMLSQMCGLCIDDCRKILGGWRDDPPLDLGPRMDKRGQMFLF